MLFPQSDAQIVYTTPSLAQSCNNIIVVAVVILYGLKVFPHFTSPVDDS